MKDDQSTNNKHMDDRLAEYADHLMSGETPGTPPSDDAGLQDLEHTLQQLKMMVDSDRPKPELSSLLEMRLQHAWEEQQNRLKQEKRGWLALLPGWLRQPPPALRFAAVAVVLLIVVIALLPGELPLQGAAGQVVSSWLPWIASVSLVILLVILIDTYRKK
jgi:hypothetical protein